MKNEEIKICSNSQFKVKSDKLSNWEKNNPVLLAGEPSIVIDGIEAEKIKFGDGVTAWNDLPYWKGTQDNTEENLPSDEAENTIVVDKEMSDTSENAIANRVVKKYVDDNKTVTDIQMSDTSNNPVANSVVKEYVDNKILPAVDYIVDMGEAVGDVGTWKYRKWNSGLVELWGATTIETKFERQVAEGHWAGTSFPQRAYPFTLYGRIDAQFSLYYTTATHLGYCLGRDGTTAGNDINTLGSTHTPLYTPYSITKDTIKRNVTGRYYVLSRWKA